MKTSRVLLVVPCLLMVGCDETPIGPLMPDGGPGGPAVTYYADVVPLVQRECLTCHVEGGIAPFSLETLEGVSEHADVVVEAVMSGYMPPWMPSRDCMSLAHERGLTAAERQVFQDWVEGGMRAGDPADAPPPPEGPPAFAETDVAHMTEPYTPDATSPDDYRCFLLDYVFESDTFLTGRQVVPDQKSIVHHVLTYAVPADQVPDVEAADAADEGPGYTCFGGPIPNDEGASGAAGNLGLIGMGGWVPGQLPFVERPGHAVYIPGGSRIVMQIHYNTLSVDPVPDQTEYHMAITTEEPEFLSTTFPTAILDLDIPAGTPLTRATRVFRNYRSAPMQLTGFTPHMHLLGTSIGMQRMPTSSGGGDPECLIDLPYWDFNWQQSYVLPGEDTVTLMPGEGLELRCEYDNSASHQPVVNGVQLDPRDVAWGEGTLDEMCLLYVQHEQPWTGPPALGCEPAADCLASCETTDADCLMGCETVGASCRACTLQGVAGCARSACLATYAPAAACFDTCILSYVMLGGSFSACMQAECPDAWPGALDCISGVVDAGTCDAALGECGITR